MALLWHVWENFGSLWWTLSDGASRDGVRCREVCCVHAPLSVNLIFAAVEGRTSARPKHLVQKASASTISLRENFQAPYGTHASLCSTTELAGTYRNWKDARGLRAFWTPGNSMECQAAILSGRNWSILQLHVPLQCNVLDRDRHDRAQSSP